MNRRERTLQSLDGLSVGDAFGERFFRMPRRAIAGRWQWTDDTQMALSIVEVLLAHHAPDFETALWTTVAGWGDQDTTRAIIGGIVAARLPVPDEWLARREPLPAGFRV
jgi:ADP-ribosylglycohydrolase